MAVNVIREPTAIDALSQRSPRAQRYEPGSTTMHNTISNSERGSCRALRIDIRVTHRELQAIRSRARRAGVGMSEYMRSRALLNLDGAPTFDVDSAELKAAYANLKRAGSNINQCARVLNTYGADTRIAEQTASAMERISLAADAVSAALAAARYGKVIA